MLVTETPEAATETTTPSPSISPPPAGVVAWCDHNVSSPSERCAQVPFSPPSREMVSAREDLQRVRHKGEAQQISLLIPSGSITEGAAIEGIGIQISIR